MRASRRWELGRRFDRSWLSDSNDRTEERVDPVGEGVRSSEEELVVEVAVPTRCKRKSEDERGVKMDESSSHKVFSEPRDVNEVPFDGETAGEQERGEGESEPAATRRDLDDLDDQTHLLNVGSVSCLNCLSSQAAPPLVRSLKMSE